MRYFTLCQNGLWNCLLNSFMLVRVQSAWPVPIFQQDRIKFPKLAISVRVTVGTPTSQYKHAEQKQCNTVPHQVDLVCEGPWTERALRSESAARRPTQLQQGPCSWMARITRLKTCGWLIPFGAVSLIGKAAVC